MKSAIKTSLSGFADSRPTCKIIKHLKFVFFSKNKISTIMCDSVVSEEWRKYNKCTPIPKCHTCVYKMSILTLLKVVFQFNNNQKFNVQWQKTRLEYYKSHVGVHYTQSVPLVKSLHLHSVMSCSGVGGETVTTCNAI